VYYDPRGKGTVPSGPNCVSRGESGANFDAELFVSGPQPVARGVARDCARTVLLTLLPCIKNMALNCYIIFTDSALVLMHCACNTVQLLRRFRLPFS